MLLQLFARSYIWDVKVSFPEQSKTLFLSKIKLADFAVCPSELNLLSPILLMNESFMDFYCFSDIQSVSILCLYYPKQN